MASSYLAYYRTPAVCHELGERIDRQEVPGRYLGRIWWGMGVMKELKLLEKL